MESVDEAYSSTFFVVKKYIKFVLKQRSAWLAPKLLYTARSNQPLHKGITSMNTVKTFGLVGLAAAGLLLAGQAFACPTAPATGDQTYGSPVCIAPVGTDGANTGLVNFLGAAGTTNSIFSSGPGIDPYTDQTSPSSYWAINGTGGSENTVVLTLTANTPNISFGIFDPSNTSNTLALFGPTANTAGFSTTLKTDGHGGFAATYFGSNPMDPSTGHKAATFGAGNLFGYYLTAGGHTYYSAWQLNPDGIAHMAAYQGTGQNTVTLTNGLFDSGEFLLAWEDGFGGGDLDYNDFVVMVESVHPVPEPAVLGMFGLGLLLIGAGVAFRRRRETEV